MVVFENISVWNQKTKEFEVKDLVVEEVLPSVGKVADVVDCDGLIAIPSAFDIHVHFREPGFTYKEDFYTGSQAALSGGVTAVLDMPNTLPPTLTKKDLIEKKALANKKALIDVFVAAGITNRNINELKEINDYADAYKVFLSESFGKLAIDLEHLREGLSTLEEIETTKTIIFHAESQAVLDSNKNKPTHEKRRPPEAEAEGIQMVLELASEFPSLHFHITHVSSMLGKKILELNNLKNVTSDTCPRYLVLDNTKELDECLIKVNPPIRTEMDRIALLEAFIKGSIDMICSDHSPHTLKEKKEECLSGMPGVQELLPIIITLVKKNELEWERAIEAFHSFPAKILGLDAQTIEKGNYVIVDYNKQFQVTKDWIKTKVKWSPYENWYLYGKAVYVIKDKKLIFAEEQKLP